MKKAGFAITLLAVSLLVGCGGPKYANGFKDWLAMFLAKNSPTKLAWVKIEKISSGKTEAVFKFTSEIQSVENLYGPGTPVDTAPATAALQKMKDADVPVPQQNEVIKLYNLISILPIYKITTPEGKGIPMSGKAQATLQNNGDWNYELIEVVGGVYKGTKEPTGKWALEGSKEAKENAVAVQEQVAGVVAAADTAIAQARDSQIAEQNRIAEEQKKQAEAAQAEVAAAQAVKNEALALCAPGSQLLGRWQGSEASGDIGIRFGTNTEIGATVAVTGVLFDPANTQYQKPFDGKITRTDDPKIPFKLVINVLKGNGGVKFEGRWDAPAIQNKTVGLLTEGCQYEINLQLTSQKILGRVFWGQRAVKGDYVHFQFTKEYSPIGNVQGNSPFNNPGTESGTPSQAPTTSAPAGTMGLPDLGGVPQVNSQQLQDADAELNRTYQNLRATLNTAGKERLKGLQREWLKARDAEMAANPMNSAAINFQATVERTAKLREAIQKAGGQSPSNQGGKYRMSLEEMKVQLSASKPLVDAYGAAMKRGDNQAGKRHLNELVAKYPQSPMTLFLQMGDAFMVNDVATAKQLYTILMTEYPDFEGMKAAYKLNFDRFMQIAKK